MSKKLLFRLVVLLMTMMCALGASAAEAYACYTPSNTTLTFYYDNYRASRTGTTYDLKNWPDWYYDGTNANVTKAVITSSFANARPTGTSAWFGGMNNLQSITGMSYLNTSEVTEMKSMFADCYVLESLDVSHFNTAKVTDMGFMFKGCELLTTLDLSNFNTSKVTNMSCMFCNCYSLTSLDLSSFNTANVTDMDIMFADCSSLTSLDVSSFNTAKVTNMSHMFRCKALTSLDLSSFNTSNVTDMGFMFYDCEALTSLDLSSFNTSNVTNMWMLFYDCERLKTIYVGNGWNTATVTESGYMFSFCTSLVGGQGTTYNESNPTDKTYARIDGGPSNPGYFTEKGPEAYACYTPSNTTLTFYYDDQRSTRTGRTYDLNTGENTPVWYTDSTCRSVTMVVFNPSFANARPTSTCAWFGDMCNLSSITGLNYLNTENVTIMLAMFYNCDKLTSLDVSNFNTANVTNMQTVFQGCTGLTSLDVSNFNTSNVTTMAAMFDDCSGLTSLDVSNFKTANVTLMNQMFRNCSGLTSLELGNFNTANVSTMNYMFNGCTNLTTIYVGSGWTTNAVTMSNNMFRNCTSLVGGMGTTYDANHVDDAYAHIDGGTANPGYLTAAIEAYACYTPSNTTLTFYYDNLRSTRSGTTYDLNIGTNEPDWVRDPAMTSVTKVVFDSSFSFARPTTTYSWFIYQSDVHSITGLEYLNTSEVTQMGYMFYECSGLTSLDLSSFNTAKVTDMSDMFDRCSGLTSLDVSSFNTANVTDMSAMFNDCGSLTSLDVSSFNTANVTDMSDMFGICSALTSLNLSNFNTSKVTDMSDMFFNCPALTSLDVSSFNTSKVTDMSVMFYKCSGLTSLDLSSFNTSNVTDMGFMFYDCEALTSLDLSSFNTAKVTDMGYMFSVCSSLKTIYVGGGWTTDAVTYSDDMFSYCSNSLVGGQGTTWNSSNPTDKTYAHIDGGPSNPGYFTAKSAGQHGDVNGDGNVNISDVTALTNLLLSVSTPPSTADINEDGTVNISDLTALINNLLSSTSK